MTKRKRKVNSKILSLDKLCPIYIMLNGEYKMFYSALQAYLYFRTPDEKVRSKILDSIEIDKVRCSGFGESVPVKANWEVRCQRKSLYEILLAKFSQDSEYGQYLLSKSKTDLAEIKMQGDGDVDASLLLSALLAVRKAIKKTKKDFGGNIQYYSAILEDN